MEKAKGLDFNESIYNLLHKQQVPTKMPRKPLYKSVFNEKIKADYEKGKASCRTMGLPAEPLPQPDNFLKKKTSEKKLAERSQQVKEVVIATTTKIPSGNMPPVPKHDQLLEVNEPTKKNFLSLNASAVAMAKPRKPSVRQVDTRTGNSFIIETSGLEPVYLNKKDYGKVPKYIVERRITMEQAREDYDAYVQERIDRGAMQQIQDDERTGLLKGLKENWDDLHSQYQTMSIHPDTFGKKKRKTYLESEMNQLEKDIQLLEGHSLLYIVR